MVAIVAAVTSAAVIPGVIQAAATHAVAAGFHREALTLPIMAVDLAVAVPGAEAAFGRVCGVS